MKKIFRFFNRQQPALKVFLILFSMYFLFIVIPVTGLIGYGVYSVVTMSDEEWAAIKEKDKEIEAEKVALAEEKAAKEKEEESEQEKLEKKKVEEAAKKKEAEAEKKKVEEAAKKKAKEKEERKVSVQLKDVTYDKDNDSIDITAKTSIPNGSELGVSAEISGSDDLLESFYEKTKVKDGKINISLKGNKDDYYGKIRILNGTYDIKFSLNINQKHEYNMKLFDEWGDYDNFSKEKDTQAKVKEWDDNNGYLLEFEFEKEIIIENAINKAEAEKIYRENSKDSYETLDYNQLIKNPNDYIGEEVRYSGEVLEIYENNGTTELRLGLDDYGLDAIYAIYYDTTDFVKGDNVTVYGMLNGEMTYESIIGAQITLPVLAADIID